MMRGLEVDSPHLNAITVPCETNHEWPKAPRGTVLDNVIPHCTEGLPNGWQIGECVRSRRVLDRNGKVMSWFPVVDRLDVLGMVIPRLASVGPAKVRLKFPTRRPLSGMLIRGMA